MEFSRVKMASLLRAIAILLCRLLLVDVACSLVCDWLIYLVVGIEDIASISSKKSVYYAKKDSDGIQVILCGIPRSGSMSLQHAMDILGFPCLHGLHLLKPTTCKLFVKAKMSGSYDDWQNLLHGYRAIADVPAASSYKELMKIYPKAKVILNTRDPEKWYRSFSRTLLDIRRRFDRQVVQFYAMRYTETFLHQQILKGTSEDKELSIQNYKLHTEEVKKHVPPHQLLVLELEKVKDWGQICEFLGVPPPNVPFLALNNTESFHNQFVTKITFVLRAVIISYLALILCVISKFSMYFFSKN